MRCCRGSQWLCIKPSARTWNPYKAGGLFGCFRYRYLKPRQDLLLDHPINTGGHPDVSSRMLCYFIKKQREYFSVFHLQMGLFFGNLSLILMEIVKC